MATMEQAVSVERAPNGRLNVLHSEKRDFEKNGMPFNFVLGVEHNGIIIQNSAQLAETSKMNGKEAMPQLQGRNIRSKVSAKDAVKSDIMKAIIAVTTLSKILQGNIRYLEIFGKIY